MSGSKKALLIVFGALAAILVVSQLVIGLLIINGRANPDILKIIKAHQHTGYTTVAVCLVYIGLSLSMILRLPTTRREG